MRFTGFHFIFAPEPIELYGTQLQIHHLRLRISKSSSLQFQVYPFCFKIQNLNKLFRIDTSR